MGGGEGAVGVDPNGPLRVVNQGVVTGTETHEVLDVGFAAVVGPSVDVVDVAPSGGTVTRREDAPGVTDPHRPGLGRGGEAGVTAHVQHDGATGHDDSSDRGTTPDPFQGGLSDGSDPLKITAGLSQLGGVTVQGGDVDDDTEAWRVAGGLGTLVVPVHQLGEGVTTTLRQRADPVGGVLRVGGCQMVEDVQQFGAGDRFEVDVDLATQPSIVTDACNRLRGWCSSWVSPAR